VLPQRTLARDAAALWATSARPSAELDERMQVSGIREPLDVLWSMHEEPSGVRWLG
jgi:hypothetical protein